MDSDKAVLEYGFAHAWKEIQNQHKILFQVFVTLVAAYDSRKILAFLTS
jgi:hypothetical protein